jgi:hypothetical protein
MNTLTNNTAQTLNAEDYAVLMAHASFEIYEVADAEGLTLEKASEVILNESYLTDEVNRPAIIKHASDGDKFESLLNELQARKVKHHKGLEWLATSLIIEQDTDNMVRMRVAGFFDTIAEAVTYFLDNGKKVQTHFDLDYRIW